jgi:hypothetical protein
MAAHHTCVGFEDPDDCEACCPTEGEEMPVTGPVPKPQRKDLYSFHDDTYHQQWEPSIDAPTVTRFTSWFECRRCNRKVRRCDFRFDPTTGQPLKTHTFRVENRDYLIIWNAS